MPTPSEIKNALLEAGLEVYQTRGDVVHIAERVRDNLIMDGRVRVHADSTSVIAAFRAHKNDFPDDPFDSLFERARSLAGPAVERGYAELETRITPVEDPSGSPGVLDTWCDVLFEKRCEDVSRAIDEVRFALGLEKTVPKG
jgi:hypothetical protein